MTTKPINILWISFEDTTPRFGCYGDRLAQTPNVDRLAREGCVYPNTFSTAGVCAPARAAIITGMYPTFIGAHHMRTTHPDRNAPGLPTPYDCVPPHYVKCVSEYFRAAGYYCTNNNKCDYQFAPPFTAWDECPAHTTGLLHAHWRNRAHGQPFFAVFNLNDTHESGMWSEKGLPRTDPAAVQLPPYLPDTLECRQALARQYDHIADNDARVGELLQQLDEDGLTDTTAVFIWSDHGEGLPRSKRWPYDTGICVPLIVRWPGQIAPGSVCHDLISTLDLGPTVLSMAGLTVPCHMQGQAFLGPHRAEPRQYIYATRDRYDEAYDMIRAVRDARFKYIRNYQPELPRLLWVPYRNNHPIMAELYRMQAEGTLNEAQQSMFALSRPAEELYDTHKDPFETNNVAGDAAYQRELMRLRAALDEWRERYDRYGDMDEAMMVHTWHVGGSQPRTAPVQFTVIAPDQARPATVPCNDGGEFAGPIHVQLHCGTQGASIGWTRDDGAAPHWAHDAAPAVRWRLYTGPITLEPGVHTLRTKAIRIGYRESIERGVTFVVRVRAG